MRNFLPNRSRSMMAAVVLGTALAVGETSAAEVREPVGTTDVSNDVVRDITRYCQACWRNAKLPADRWDDCTQQVFARLLETVPVNQWGLLLVAEESVERREFVRAIDAAKKRTQRARKFTVLTPDIRDDKSMSANTIRDQRDAVSDAAKRVLSDRQKTIVELSADGWAVPEIASVLKTTPERISDEKYKAIRKLRVQLGVE